jgi:hypothetical protein
MRRTSCVALVVAAALAIPAAAAAAGTDPTARAAFAGPIQVNGAKATLKVRYRCSSGQNLWVSAKETAHGYSATKLMKEGSSRTAAAWWDSHRNRVVCDGKFRSTTFTIDKVEKGKKGTLVDGSAWVQFCVTNGHTEADTVLTLSKSGWVRVNA